MDSLSRQIKDLESWMPIIENLSNPGLKQIHWDDIRRKIGSEIDFKKISIEKIKFMKIEHLLEPIFKISEVASHEYSIELLIKEMNIETDKQFQKIENTTKTQIGDIFEIKLIKDFISEQQSNLKTLRSNKYIERLLGLVEQQEAKLEKLEECIKQKLN